MHVRWKNCPQAWVGQYQGKEKEPTVVLEASAEELQKVTIRIQEVDVIVWNHLDH